MQMQAVWSSSVAAVGYSVQAHKLVIHYVRGGRYRYVDVPPEVHRLLMEATSKGRFVNRVIKPAYMCVVAR